MLISCGVCNSKSAVIEILELKDIKEFTNRILIIGKCPVCYTDIAALIEIRIADNKTFIDRFTGDNALKVIKRERKRLKNKQDFNLRNNLQGWIYGINKEHRNKFGEVTSIKQYSCDFKTGKKKLEKTIYN